MSADLSQNNHEFLLWIKWRDIKEEIVERERRVSVVIARAACWRGWDVDGESRELLSGGPGRGRGPHELTSSG